MTAPFDSVSPHEDAVQRLVDFWASEYLGWYVKQGGSKVKLVTSVDSAMVAAALSSLHDRALSKGFSSYMVDARGLGRLRLATVYRALLGAVDLDSLVEEYCSRIVARIGYNPEKVSSNRSFVDWAVQSQGRDQISICREINELLENDLFRNPAVNRSFATAIMQLCGAHIGSRAMDRPEKDNMKEALYAWMRGGDVPLRDLRRYHVYTRIDRYNARVMLRSLAQVVRMAGKTGLVLIIGGLDTLLDRRETGRPIYTKAARDEFYESVRQFIDEVEVFGHTMIVLGFSRELVDDASLGLRSYEALWLRLQNEVAGDRPNPFRDFVDLDSFASTLGRAPSESTGWASEYGDQGGRSSGFAEDQYSPTVRDFADTSIIETLRSGVTSKGLANLFLYGREALLERMQRELSKVRETGDSQGIIIRGEYGEGKTHLLNAIANEALENGFVVSFVVLSKETPFSRLDKVYPKLVASTYIPGQAEPGIAPLFRDLRPDGDAALGLLRFAEEELHPKLYHVLYDYLHVGDTYNQHLLQGDLSGQFFPTAFIKAIHRTTTGRSARIPRFVPKTDVYDYLKLVSESIRRRGMPGWLILFDEFELVGTLGAQARAESYLNLEPFLGMRPSSAPQFTLSLFSVASRYWPDILLRERRPDTSEIPARLSARGRAAEAKRVERVLRTLLQEPVSLGTLTEAEIAKMLLALAATHGKAYSWPGDLDVTAVEAATRHVRLRTRIRYALECLDLEFLYGDLPEVATGKLQEQSLAEGEMEEVGEDGQDKVLER